LPLRPWERWVTEADLKQFVWVGGPDKLSDKDVVKFAGEDSSAAVEQESLDDFFRAVPPEDRAKFDELAKVLKEQLSDIKVYKVGDEAEKTAYVVGRTKDNRWAGLKTTVGKRSHAEATIVGATYERSLALDRPTKPQP
jgi:hypothetical protein